MTTELHCKELIFSFNKKHLEDASVPMWTIKAKGQTFYVNHVTCTVPWSTKESPDNAHTKGAIKVKQVLLVIDDQLEATITEITDADRLRLAAKQDPGYRVAWMKHQHSVVSNYMKAQQIKHTPIRLIYGSCGSEWKVTDIKHEHDLISMELAMHGYFRRLSPTDYLSVDYDKHLEKWASSRSAKT